MQFYNVKLKKSVDVEEKDFQGGTRSNVRRAAKASVTLDGGSDKMFRILSKEDAKKYS